MRPTGRIPKPAVAALLALLVASAPVAGDASHDTLPAPDNGITVQVHRSWFGFRHVSLRIEPNDPEAWSDHPIFRTDRDTGRLFATLGAQSRKIRGKLVARPNRRTDRKNHKIEVAPVKLDERGEDQVIAELLAAESGYRDDARYRAFPKRWGRGYNSNSFVSGLLRAVRLTPPRLRSRVRGYDVPVPEEFFEHAATAVIDIREPPATGCRPRHNRVGHRGPTLPSHDQTTTPPHH